MAVDVADPGLKFEAMTLPHGTYKRKFDITKWIANWTIADKWDDINDGVFELPQSFTKSAQLLTVDQADHSNDVGTIIRVSRAGTNPPVPVLHYVLRQMDDTWDATKGTVTCILEGMDFYLDRARVPRHDYAAKPSRDPDWIYGAESVIRSIGGELTGEVVEVKTDATSGNFTLTFGAETTGNLAFNATAAQVETALELLTNIDDVDVSGVGDPLSPWTITFPSDLGNVSNITANIGTLNQPITASIIRNGGTMSPRPWHGSYNPVTKLMHGTYDQFEVVTTNMPAGDDYTLAVNGGLPVFAGDFCGAQIIQHVVPGRTYRASIPVRALAGTEVFRLVIRDMSENLIAATPDTSVGTTYTTLSIPTFTVPPGITEIIYRVGIINGGNPGAVYIGIQSAILAPGEAAALLGKMLLDVFTVIQSFGILTWVTPTFTATHDSGGVPWDEERSWSIKRRMSLLQVMEYARRWRYESSGIVWSVANARFEWNVYNPEGGGVDKANTGLGITGKSGGVLSSGALSVRMPDATYYDAEGTGGEWGEYNDTVMSAAWGRLEQYFPNAQGLASDDLEILAERLVQDSARKTAGVQIRMQAPVKEQLPWSGFRPGDRNIMVNLAPKKARNPMRCAGIVASGVRGTSTPVYDVHFGSMVYRGEVAVLQSLRVLRRKYETLEMVRAQEETLDPLLTAAGGKAPTFVIAASNSKETILGTNPRADYVCTGVSDQVIIRDAITQLASSGGGVILFREGDYYFSGPCVVANSVRLIGLGMEGTRFHMAAAANGDMWEVFASGATVEFVGMAMDGSKATQTSGSGCGIRANPNGATDIWVTDCDIFNFRGCGVDWSRHAGNFHITGSKVHGNTSHGLLLVWEGTYHVSDNDIWSNGGAGIWCDYAREFIVRGNRIYLNTSYGIAGGGTFQEDGQIIQANYVYGNGNTGILINGHAYIIDANWCVSNAGSGIAADGVAHPASVTDNHCNLNTLNGFTFGGTAGGTAAGNTAYHNGRHGFEVASGAWNLKGNTADSNGRTTHNTYDNIRIAGDNCDVVGNTCRQDTFANKVKYGINITATADATYCVTNDSRGAATANYLDAGTNTINVVAGPGGFGDNY